MRIGLVTCLRLPEPDPDHGPLVRALTRRGHEPVSIPWDGPDESYDTDVNVLRSAWNYHEAPDAFLWWVERAASRAPLVNPPDVVRWNIHKKYLAALQGTGVPIVPTRWFTRGARIDVASILAEAGWRRIVIKPSISAASYRTRTFQLNELAAAQLFADQLVADRDVLVQQFLDGYGDPGERSLVWIADEWTHAVRKLPRFDGQAENVEAAAPPQRSELRIADAAIAPLRNRLAYARIDLVSDLSGAPVVSEVELMEPSLFFDHGPPHAIERFIDRIEAARTR